MQSIASIKRVKSCVFENWLFWCFCAGLMFIEKNANWIMQKKQVLLWMVSSLIWRRKHKRCHLPRFQRYRNNSLQDCLPWLHQWYSNIRHIFLWSQLFCLGFIGRRNIDWSRWRWNSVTSNINPKQVVCVVPGIKRHLKSEGKGSNFVFETRFCTAGWVSVWTMQSDIQWCIWACETQAASWKPNELWSGWKHFHRAGGNP